MKHLLESERYREDLDKAAHFDIEWSKLHGRTFLITGASGMIGSFLIDLLLTGRPELNARIIAIVRDEDKARVRFAEYLNSKNFELLVSDINQKIQDFDGKVDYVIHGASNTHPRAYASDPVQTLLTNITGTDHVLRCGMEHGMDRFVFLSSVEVYGENRGDVERFGEDYCGYIDCNTLRAGYPEGKRAGEALCQAYISECGADIVIPRLSRTYGPTMLMSDSKAISQFIKKGVAGEDVILKSEGNQLYSYSYVADAVTGILTCLMKGETGQAYNIADAASDVTLARLAEMIAGPSGRQVVFELPDALEKAGYSKATKALLDSSRLGRLGWKAMYDMQTGLAHTIEILREIQA